MENRPSHVQSFLDEIEAPFVTSAWAVRPDLRITGSGSLPSVFATTELATASLAAAGRAAARVVSTFGSSPTTVEVDRRLASLWFIWTIKPVGWESPSPWDDLAGAYPTRDGWIRLHTNAPHHRRAALSVLAAPSARPDVEWVRGRVADWAGDDLEAAIVDAGGCAARLRSEAEWSLHPQGVAVAAEPLADISRTIDPPPPVAHDRGADAQRPLRGVRVLDLTRVLAGPIATRFLAGLGADVLRVDPPDWEEPGVIPEVTRGKRCGRIDLRSPTGRQRLLDLMAGADIVVHGYRGDAMERLGLGDEERRRAAPGLVDVSLNAYGWTGPWRFRRGFDSLVQMSCGIADTGGLAASKDADSHRGRVKPRPLPTQALDHATGYLLATAALHGWAERRTGGSALVAKVSLARTAKVLLDGPRTDPETSVEAAADADWEDQLEQTSWGPARRLKPPLAVDGVPWFWERPATALGTEKDLAWL